MIYLNMWILHTFSWAKMWNFHSWKLPASPSSIPAAKATENLKFFLEILVNAEFNVCIGRHLRRIYLFAAGFCAGKNSKLFSGPSERELRVVCYG